MESSQRTPSNQTLKKYGLSLQEWQALYNKYDGCCHVCGKSFNGRRACVDHEHVKGWGKMLPEKRKQFVRGLCCFQCNKLLLPKMATIKILKAAVKYLESYENRKKSLPPL